MKLQVAALGFSLLLALVGCGTGTDGTSQTGGTQGGGGQHPGTAGGGAGGGSGSGGAAAAGGTMLTGTGGVGSGGSGGGRAGAGGTTVATGSGGKGEGGAGGAAGKGAGTGGTTSAGGTSGHGGGTGGVGGSATGGGGGGATGGGGGSATGGVGGGAAYQPCPSNGTPCKILPFGDSITFGVNDEGNAGYRGPLFADVVAAGQKITFTGSLSDGPTTVSGQSFPKNNEGHSGWGISEVNPNSGGNAGIITVIPSPAFASGSGGLPNIILLHIGTNDQGSFSATQMISDLGGLIDKVVADAPDALLVVAQIIPLGYGTNSVIKAYNQALPGLLQPRVAAGKHIVLVDMYTGFTTSTMLGSDNIHPNSTGYKFMADHWYAAIKDLLPK